MKSLSETFHTAALRAALPLADSKSKARRPPGPRRQQIEADHRVALSRAYAYQAQRTRSAEDMAALDREYQTRMAEGPDFTRYRSKSDFREPPPHRLDRNALARLRFTLNSMARGSWRQRDKGKHRGLISRTAKDVFAALLLLAERYDRLFPSLERLASLAQCCKQSVVDALAQLERLGFITRHRRIRMIDTVMGRKVEQATNAYELHPPRRGWGALAVALFSTERESRNSAATDTACLSYLRDHPETWGSHAAYGGKRSAP